MPVVGLSTSSCAPEGEDLLLEALYGSVSAPNGWSIFADALARAYAGGKAVLYVHDTVLRDWRTEATGRWEADYIASYNRYYSKLNPWLGQAARRPVGVVETAEAALSPAELIKTEFHHDWLRPQGLLSGVGGTIQRDGSRFMAVSVLFPEKTRERDTEAVGRLQRLVPHLLRAAQLRRQLGGLEVRAASAEAALDRLAVGLFILDARQGVVFLNKTAEAIVAARDGLTTVGKLLQPVALNERKAFRDLVGSALRARSDISAPPGGVMRVGRVSGRLDYEVLVSPISSDTLSLSLAGTLVAVFVRDPETQVDAPLHWLRRLYSLTKAEALVMQGVIAGKELEEIAVELGKSRETVRSQLKSVFRKTGADSQTELVRRCVGCLTVFVSR